MGQEKDSGARSLSKKKDPTTRKRLQLGDVLEIPLSDGQFAYAQYVFYHREPPVYGPLVRVLEGKYRQRPAEFKSLIEGPDQFVAFCPLQVPFRMGLWRIVAHEPVPERFGKLPLFKAHNRNYETGYTMWFLWDGRRSVKVGESLPEAHWDLPVKQIVDYSLLVERIERGWRHCDEVFYTPPTALRKREPNI